MSTLSNKEIDNLIALIKDEIAKMEKTIDSMERQNTPTLNKFFLELKAQVQESEVFIKNLVAIKNK